MSAKYYKAVIKTLAERAGLTDIEKMLAVNQPSKFVEYGKLKREYKVILQDCGERKISVIKEIRFGSGLGLKEAKDLADSAPCLVRETEDLASANEFIKKLAEVGASAYLE
jgi:large subunit ribosomal protein L7/L12